SLNASNINPAIPFTASPFRVQQEVEAWDRPTRNEDGHVITYPRRAGISSFGAGGSNAHVILEEHVTAQSRPPDQPDISLILLSARRRGALEAYAARLAVFLRRSLSEADGSQAPRLTDIAFTLQVGRAQFDERLALVVSSVDELVERLSSWVAG